MDLFERLGSLKSSSVLAMQLPGSSKPFSSQEATLSYECWDVMMGKFVER